MPDFPVPMLVLRAIQLVILVEKKTLHCHLGGVTVTHMLWPQLWQSGERVESVFLSFLQACSVYVQNYYYLVDRWSRKISVIIFCLTISNSGPDLFWELSNYNYVQQSTPPSNMNFYNILFISLLLVGESLHQEERYPGVRAVLVGGPASDREGPGRETLTTTTRPPGPGRRVCLPWRSARLHLLSSLITIYPFMMPG